MFNKKRLVALSVSSAMIMASIAGCSSSSASKADSTTAAATTAAGTTAADTTAADTTAEGDTTVADTTAGADKAEGDTTAADTTASPEESTEAPTQAPDSDVIAPSYAVESGKVIDFEDEKSAFVLMNVQTPVSDNSTISVVDFNGSKALKIEPKGTDAGMAPTIGLDVTSLLGEKVSEVAKVSMQIGVEAADGKFHACSGVIYQNYTDATGTKYSVYSKRTNPAEVTVEFGSEYDASAKNVLTITKDSNSGSNSDTAYQATGAYSTLYIDNIVFFDKDGNPIEVNTDAVFDAPDGFGDADWSNLIKVTEQTVIPGFAVSNQAGWAQGPTANGQWTITNRTTTSQDVQAKDEEGNPVVDEDGKPVYVQAVDEEGNPVVDEEGNPVYEKEEVVTGNLDLASIMKPGTVFTLYFTTEPQGNWNEYVWFVLNYNDYNLGWNRLLASNQIPKDAGLDYETSTPEEKKGYVFSINDSFCIAQVTYEEIINYIDMLYADKLPEGVTAADIDWSGAWGLQVEAGSTLTVSAVTYSLDQEY